MEPARFTLKDGDGVPHEYLVPLHSGTEGRTIVLSLLAAGIPALGAVLDGLLKTEAFLSLFKAEGGARALLDAKWGELVTHLQATPVVERLANVAMLLAANDGAMVDAIFRHAVRDGKPLRERVHFDAAYQGNYLEMGQALAKIVQVNRFFPVPSTSSTPSAK